MIWTILPWVVSILTITSMWLAGNKSPWAWKLGLTNQILWLILILHSQLWGLLLTTVFLCFVYSRNLYKWNKDNAKKWQEDEYRRNQEVGSGRWDRKWDGEK